MARSTNSYARLTPDEVANAQLIIEELGKQKQMSINAIAMRIGYRVGSAKSVYRLAKEGATVSREKYDNLIKLARENGIPAVESVSEAPATVELADERAATPLDKLFETSEVVSKAPARSKGPLELFPEYAVMFRSFARKMDSDRQKHATWLTDASWRAFIKEVDSLATKCERALEPVSDC